MRKKKSDNGLANIAIYTAVLSPVFSMYGAGGISLAIILIVFSFALMMVGGFLAPIKSLPCVALTIYIVVQLFLYNLSSSVFLRTVQYLLLLTIPFMIKFKKLNFEKGVVFYRYISLLASLFIIIQYICLTFLHIYISGIIDNPIFPPSESLSDILGGTLETGRRVSGIFSEPASHSVYVLGAYAITLFDKSLKKKFFYITVFSIGILCSVSSTGILTMSCLLAIYLFYDVKSTLKWISRPRNIIAVFAFASVLIYVLNSGIQELFLYRIEEGNSANNRFVGFSMLAAQSFLELIMGHGMDLEAIQDSYFSGYPRYIYYFGFWGVSLWLLMLIKVTRNVESRFKYLALTYLVLNMGESSMLGFSGYLFMMFLCYAKYGKSYITNRFLLSQKQR